MTTTPNGKATNKAKALAAIDRAKAETARPDCSPAVMAALLGDAWLAVEQIEELKRKRPARKKVAA